MVKINELDSGDMLFFHSNNSTISNLIEWVTSSKVAHTGIVIKDPWFEDNHLQGLYLLESTCDKKVKWGVKLCKLDDVIAEYNLIYVRKLKAPKNNLFKDKMNEIYDQVKNIPYDLDIGNWYIAALNHLHLSKDKVKKHQNSMWCSALVGFVYVKLGYIDKETDYSNLAPNDLETICTIPNDLLDEVCLLDI